MENWQIEKPHKQMSATEGTKKLTDELSTLVRSFFNVKKT
jgi:hypothetical protein